MLGDHTHPIWLHFLSIIHSNSPSPLHCILHSFPFTETAHFLSLSHPQGSFFMFSPLHTLNPPYFTPFSVHFCPKGRNHPNQTNLLHPHHIWRSNTKELFKDFNISFGFKGSFLSILCSFMFHMFMLNLL